MNIRSISNYNNISFGARLSAPLLAKHQALIKGDNVKERKSEALMARLDAVLPGYEVRAGKGIQLSNFSPPYNIVVPLEVAKDNGEEKDTIKLSGHDGITGDWMLDDDMSIETLGHVVGLLEAIDISHEEL